METTKPRPIPIVILAGGDPRPPELPEAGSQLHPLEGPKGVALQIDGHSIIDLLIDRLRHSGLFRPIFIAGPALIYGADRKGCPVIDTDSTFSDNLKAAVTAVANQCPNQPLAITTCDILPQEDELEWLMEDYHHHQPLDFWFPVILAPEESDKLGASYWKPRYRISPLPGSEPRSLLPGHLIVADPQALRLPLIYRTFGLAYDSRNRPILYRLQLIIRHIFLGLVLQDLKYLVTLRLPTMTYTVVSNGVALGLRLRKGVVTPEELAERLRRIYVRYEHRRRHPERKGRLPLKHGLSLAKDIDTVEEAKEMERGLGARSSS